jgi:ribosomal protein L44E
VRTVEKTESVQREYAGQDSLRQTRRRAFDARPRGAGSTAAPRSARAAKPLKMLLDSACTVQEIGADQPFAVVATKSELR